MKRILLICCVALIVVLTACQPQHYGASILSQSRAGGGQYDGPIFATSGHTKIQGADVMAAHVDEQSGAIVITDFEHNGVSIDGVWDTADHNAYFRMVFMRERCTVLVLGWRTDTVPQALLDARADIQTMASQRLALGWPTVIVDWRDTVVAHPEYIHTDGVHLASEEAAIEFADEIRRGISECP